MKAHQLPPNAIVVSKDDIANIKKRSVVMTAADEARAKEARAAALAEKQKAAKEIQKRRLLQEEENAKKQQEKSDHEIMKQARADAIKQVEAKEIDGNLDLVKMLNTLGARASAFTIRDGQLASKLAREQLEAEYDKRHNDNMEVHRLQAQLVDDEREKVRLAKRMEDRRVILEQVAKREKQKLMAEEAREQENQAMKELIAKYKADDVKAAERKKAQIEATKREVVLANEKAIAFKERAKQRDRDEELAVLEFLARKDADMRKREEEELEKARIMKERQAKLLAMQEKTQNTQAEIDEKRAIQYAETRERRERERERREREQKQACVNSMMQGRQAQSEFKIKMKAREAEMQALEYEDAVTYAVKDMRRDQEAYDAQKKKTEMNRDLLKTQIEEREIAARKAKGRKAEEGKKFKYEFATERAKLEAIRDKMVHDMEKGGTNPKYLSEMKMADIHKIQMR